MSWKKASDKLTCQLARKNPACLDVTFPFRSFSLLHKEVNFSNGDAGVLRCNSWIVHAKLVHGCSPDFSTINFDHLRAIFGSGQRHARFSGRNSGQARPGPLVWIFWIEEILSNRIQQKHVKWSRLQKFEPQKIVEKLPTKSYQGIGCFNQ